MLSADPPHLDPSCFKGTKMTVKSIGRILAIMVLAALARPVFCASHAKTQPQSGASDRATADSAGSRLLSDIDCQKAVRDAYARLMRYHSAARDEKAAADHLVYAPEDYVTFELRGLHTGPISDIENQPVSPLVTQGSSDGLQVTPHHIEYAKGPAHAY
jgi:hypothetical protein